MRDGIRPSRRSVVLGTAASLALGRFAMAEGLPTVAVTKDPSCGCCGKWIAHLREAGFSVNVADGPVNPVKVRLGVPRDLTSCHTAQVGRYVVEGHIPAGAIKRLIAEKPDATGLAVPGMPVGSPGMEVDGMEPDTYDVVLFGLSGRGTFERYRGGVKA